ncbi:recombinase family protein [Zoogloea sp.]|uniref:recombinase family protein n=1 Tax=Zoogloea sp. TaxID=49181 RepID=UPI002FE23CCF
MALKEQAISYVRFSSAQQALGDSKRRQLERAQQWCDKHGVELLSEFTFQDLGLSAFRSKNSRTGQLAALVEAAKSGRIIRGTYLVVEAFDRLTRDELQEAIDLLKALVSAGLRVVTVLDGQVWDADTIRDPMRFIYAVLMLSQGHVESAKKSERIGSNWSEARKTLDRSKFGIFPGWLRRTADGSTWEPIPERVEIIRRVFALAIEGYGSYTLAKKLNQEGVPPVSGVGAWTSGRVSKLLVNRALIGEYEFKVRDKGKAVATGTIVPDWYPVVIEPSLFHQARMVITGRKTLPAKRRDRSYRNILFGLAYCGKCGASMIRRNMSGSNRSVGYGRYVCSYSNHAKTSCPTVHAHTLEHAVVESLVNYFSGSFVSAERVNEARAAIEAAKGAVADKELALARLDEALKYSRQSVQELVQLRDKASIELATAKADLDEAERVFYGLDTPTGVQDDLDSILAALHAPDDNEAARDIRARFHTRLTSLVEHISIHPTAALALIKASGMPWHIDVAREYDEHGNRTSPLLVEFATPIKKRG